MKKINRKRLTLKRAHDYERRVARLDKEAVEIHSPVSLIKMQIRRCNSAIVHFDDRLLEWVDGWVDDKTCIHSWLSSSPILGNGLAEQTCINCFARRMFRSTDQTQVGELY